jgi:hypothetical protein
MNYSNSQQYDSESLHPHSWEYAIKDIPYNFVDVKPIPSYMKAPELQASIKLSSSSHLHSMPCVDISVPPHHRDATEN